MAHDQASGPGTEGTDRMTYLAGYDTMTDVELAFRTRTLRARCEDPATAKTDWTPEVREQLQNRIADIRAADSPLELIAGAPKLLEGRHPSLEIRLTHDYVIVCQVNHAAIPRNEQAKVQWKRIRRVRVDEIRRVE